MQFNQKTTSKHLAKSLAVSSIVAVGLGGCAESPFGAKQMDSGYQNQAKPAEAMQQSTHTNQHLSQNQQPMMMEKTTEAKCSEGMCGGKTATAGCGTAMGDNTNNATTDKSANAGCGASR